MKNVCLIEDEKELRDIIEIYLIKNGYKVMSCSNLKEACDVLNNDAIDVWVIDLMLPDGSGFDILKDIKAKSNSPVILISARNDSIDETYRFSY